MPASSWQKRPKQGASPRKAAPDAALIQPALDADSRNVVRAKPASPSGAGSAMLETGAGTVAGWTVRSSLTLKSIPPSEERLVRSRQALRLPVGRMPGVNCVAGVKHSVSHARTFLWSHLAESDHMKDPPTA